ncbi:MAG: hypothetical protein QOF78_970 [Phycisphaerales bacterium]|jgi:hypothetical protein|nr:hypothetical protein [Phycisphaerales bacterium]
MGRHVFVKTMTGTQRDAFEAAHLAAKKAGDELANFRARLAVATVCNEAGELLFAASDAVRLGETHAKSLDRVWEVARRLNGLTDS